MTTIPIASTGRSRPPLGANGDDAPTLEIVVPYLAATYDERMFEELYRRVQLFAVTLGGDMRVEGRIEPEHVKREKAGIGTEDEDLGTESGDTESVDLPKDWTFAKRRIKANFIDVSPYSSLKNGPKLALKWQIAKVQ